MLPNFLDLRYSKAVNAYFIGVKKLEKKEVGTDGDLTKSVD